MADAGTIATIATIAAAAAVIVALAVGLAHVRQAIEGGRIGRRPWPGRAAAHVAYSAWGA